MGEDGCKGIGTSLKEQAFLEGNVWTVAFTATAG